MDERLAGNGSSQADQAPEESISLLQLLLVLARHKKLIVGVPFLAAVVAAIVSLTLPAIYTGTARILPPQQGQPSAAAMMGTLGTLAGYAVSPSLFKNPGDLYVVILRSRTVADNLIREFGLREVYGAPTVTAARDTLQGVSTITSSKEGVVTIEVEDRDPKRAAALANGYVDELYNLNKTLAITEASQRRLFFEQQLRSAKNDLANAEMAMKRTQEATGLIKLDDQGKAIIELVARLQAQVAAKEVQVGAMQSFASEQNADIVVARQELAGLRAQLAKVERDHKLGGGNILVPTGRIPEAGLEYVRKFRDVKYHETIFELLAKQYEIAKIDEARDSSLVQVLDRAIEPEKRTKPARTRMVLFTAVVAGLASVLLAFVIEAVRNDPRHAERLALLRFQLLGR